MKAIRWWTYLQVFRARSNRKSDGITCIHVGCIHFDQSPACLFSHSFLVSKSASTTAPTSQLHQRIQYLVKTRYKDTTSMEWHQVYSPIHSMYLVAHVNRKAFRNVASSAWFTTHWLPPKWIAVHDTQCYSISERKHFAGYTVATVSKSNGMGDDDGWISLATASLVSSEQIRRIFKKAILWLLEQDWQGRWICDFLFLLIQGITRTLNHPLEASLGHCICLAWCIWVLVKDPTHTKTRVTLHQ